MFDSLKSLYSSQYVEEQLEKAKRVRSAGIGYKGKGNYPGGAGEGSKGGKVVGHTSSGKPIYTDAAAKGYSVKRHSDRGQSWTDFDHENGHRIQVTNIGGKHHVTSNGKVLGKDLSKEDAHELARKNFKKAEPNTIGLTPYTKHTNIMKSFDHLPTENDIRMTLGDKLIKGIISQEIHDKAIEQLDNLVKAKGEGSRGGKIIGHTHSGKPVYAGNRSDHKDHKDWDSLDHKNAEEYHYSESMSHGEAASKHRQGTGSYNNHRALSMHHRDVAEGHAAMADKKDQEKLSDDDKQIVAERKKKQITHHEDQANYHDEVSKHLASIKTVDQNHPKIKAEVQRFKDQADHHRGEAERLKNEK